MAVQNSVRSYIGIAKEVTKGTAVAPTDYLLVNKDTVKPVNVIDPLYDQGLRGAMVENYNYIPGRTHSTFDLGGVVFADGIDSSGRHHYVAVQQIWFAMVWYQTTRRSGQ